MAVIWVVFGHSAVIMISFSFFEFSMMNFGLHNVAQTFQRFMDQVVPGSHLH